MSLYKGTQLIAGGGSGGGSGRNIGDIFYTKRTDTALAGAVECNGGTYNTEDYEGDGSIGELLETGKLDYISLTAYATAISAKGWCDKIGWNGTGTTSFRVPTLTPHIIQKNNIPVIGNGISLGLTKGSTNVNLQGDSNGTASVTVGQYGNPVGSPYSAVAGVNSSLGVTTDGTKSGIIADTSDTAQLRVMFQLFNGATDEAVATCTSVLADVADLKQNKVTKGHEVIAFQAPTAANNHTWYRLYADGWVEQGGQHVGGLIVSFPIAMANTDYFTMINSIYNNSGAALYFDLGYIATKTKTGMTKGGNAANYNWFVVGMAE